MSGIILMSETRIRALAESAPDRRNRLQRRGVAAGGSERQDSAAAICIECYFEHNFRLAA
jgi:hypothetical protein